MTVYCCWKYKKKLKFHNIRNRTCHRLVDSFYGRGISILRMDKWLQLAKTRNLNNTASVIHNSTVEMLIWVLWPLGHVFAFPWFCCGNVYNHWRVYSSLRWNIELMHFRWLAEWASLGFYEGFETPTYMWLWSDIHFSC
jgi:hypothetical protein